MRRKEIPQKEWNEFLKSFMRQHRGWLVTVSEQHHDGGDKTVARDVALRTIRLVTDNGKKRILLDLGKENQIKTIHRIVEPRSVWFVRTSQGEHIGMDIETDMGDVTAIRFRTAILPEQADGIITNRTE